MGWRLWATAAAVVTIGVGLIWSLRPEDTARLQSRAEASAARGDWPQALEAWRRINATPRATGRTHEEEARACLALGRAAQAERALRRAVSSAPEEPASWLLLLEILRVEDRPVEALVLGFGAIERVPVEARPRVLRELTLATLTELPDELARTTLRRWIDADPDDLDARVAWLKRIAAEPRPDDPDRSARLVDLEGMLAAHPEHPGVREALVTALADTGEPDRGRRVLDGWPDDRRDDARYLRLVGRWALDFEHRPGQAIEAFRGALTDLPQDWRTHYRLARALKSAGRSEEARVEAETVARLRELLEPSSLGPRLDSALARLGDRSARINLANLCARAGLRRLAEAWAAQGEEPDGPIKGMERIGH